MIRPVHLFSGVSDIFLSGAPGVGMLVMLLMLFFPGVGLGGLISLGGAWAFARLVNRTDMMESNRVLLYNPLLVGFAAGHACGLSPAGGLASLAGGVLTFWLSVSLNHTWERLFSLPVLSLPFVISANLLVLGGFFPGEGGSEISVPYWMANMSLPRWLEGYLTAAGAVFFLPVPWVGVLIIVGLLFHSRILCLLSLLGYLAGNTVVFLTQGCGELFSDPGQFNCMLVAMALGGIFLIPSPSAYLLAAGGASLAALISMSTGHLLADAGIQMFTLPFNIVAYGALYFLSIVEYPLLAWQIKASPEETLGAYLFSGHRYDGRIPQISPPFDGEWTVWQEVSGGWTHKGRFCHALDFIITNDAGEPFSGTGRELSDYFCFEQPVLAPVDGVVISVRITIPDNPVGEVNPADNWGNCIVLQADSGYFVEISHLSPASIPVFPGARVVRGMQIGLCGNSGYSPQPHIHVQVQTRAALGSDTRPFEMAGMIIGSRYVFRGLPETGDRVRPAVPATAQKSVKSFVLDDEIRFEVFKGPDSLKELKLRVITDEQGRTCLDSGLGKLFFSENHSSFFFTGMEGRDPRLELILAAIPGHPLVLKRGTIWEEKLPLGLMEGRWSRLFRPLQASFNHGVNPVRISLVCRTDFQVAGRHDRGWESLVSWDNSGRLVEIQIQGYRFVRTDGPTVKELKPI